MVLVVKNPPAKVGDVRDCGFHPWVGKIPGRREWHPLQHSCQGNFTGRGVWQAPVHGAAKSRNTTECLSRQNHLAAGYDRLWSSFWCRNIKMCLRIDKTVVSPPYLWVRHPWIQSSLNQKNFLIWERSKKQNLNFLCAGNYLHGIYIVLSIIRNLEMISRMCIGYMQILHPCI